jgi:hypothetical protein
MLRIIPLSLKEANAMVERYHRHHKPVQGHRFSIGMVDDKGQLRGAAIVGRPVSRMVDARSVLEITRLVTDGTANACSMLYGRAARIARELGYEKIQTYILENESGVSLRAAGWECEDRSAGGGQWNHTDGKARRIDQPTCRKQRWSKRLTTDSAPILKIREAIS